MVTSAFTVYYMVVILYIFFQIRLVEIDLKQRWNQIKILHETFILFDKTEVDKLHILQLKKVYK